MVKKYVWIFVVVISVCCFAGIYLYGFQSGRISCEEKHAVEQKNLIQSTTDSVQKAEEIVNSATLDDVRGLLCEDARDSCEERTDNTSTGM